MGSGSEGRGKRSKKSLCEKSMNIVLNIIKVSSLSLASISLGSVSDPPPPVSAALEAPVAPLVLGSTAGTTVVKKLVEPEPEQKRASYLMEPGDDINWRAVQYINGIHERNIHESKKRSGAGDYMLLPPPPFRAK
ncbi:hypothetical protein H6P81_015270 [Aristolochia fimbriata]|uniref:Uncharacterized protein n=1 Tax=Aristolochia fimbriata TaxID=158543 RepID=A0AAV7E4T6_ARIFI|nr:hypothetical protein H6P81_015270 [Aristolochia fimbriata]